MYMFTETADKYYYIVGYINTLRRTCGVVRRDRKIVVHIHTVMASRKSFHPRTAAAVTLIFHTTDSCSLVESWPLSLTTFVF